MKANIEKSEPTLYERFLREREEILKHKWIESEKNGCDIGLEKALIDWITNYRKGWRDETHFSEFLNN